MAGFDRFNKVWSDTGVKLPPSDAQASAGFAYLGPTPPSVELFNGINSDLDEKDNWLYNQLASVMTAGGSGPPSATDPDDLRDAIMNLISGAAVPAGTYVRIIGDWMTGSLGVAGPEGIRIAPAPAGQANFVLDAPSGFNKIVSGETGGLDRWQVILGDATPEGGADSGSHFIINRVLDGGTLADQRTVLTLNRTDGSMTLIGHMNATSITASALIQSTSGRIISAAGATPSLTMLIPGLNASGFWNASGSDIAFGLLDGTGNPTAGWGNINAFAFQHSGTIIAPFINAYPASGAWSNSAISVGGSDTNSWKLSTDNTGNLHIIPTIGGVAGPSYYIVPDTGGGGAFNCPDAMRVGTKRDNFFYLQSNAAMAQKAVVFADPTIGGSVVYQEVLDAIDTSIIPNQVTWRVDNNGVTSLGSYNTAGNNYDRWSVASSGEYKTDITDYVVGLDDICKLRPIRFKYNDQLPAPFLNNGEDKVGLIAEEVEAVWPTMVHSINSGVSNVPLVQQEMKMLNLHETTFAMINAFKEIQVRLTALETTAQPRRS